MIDLFNISKGITSKELAEVELGDISYRPKKRKSFEELNIVQQVYLLTDVPFDIISAIIGGRPIWDDYSSKELFSFLSKVNLVRSALENGVPKERWDVFISYYQKDFGVSKEEAESSELVKYLKGGEVSTDKLHKVYSGME